MSDYSNQVITVRLADVEDIVNLVTERVDDGILRRDTAHTALGRLREAVAEATA